MDSNGDDDDSPWNNFSTVITDCLGSSAALARTDNFQQIGGTSLNVVAAVLQLNQSGFPVTIEQFLEAENMEALFRGAANGNNRTAASGEYTAAGSPVSPHQFTIVPIQQVDTVAAQTLLGECFVGKSCMHIFNTGSDDVKVEHYLYVLGKLWEGKLFDRYSFAVTDEKGKLRAVALATDLADMDGLTPDSTAIHPHFLTLIGMVGGITTPVKEALNPTHDIGVILYKFMLGASLDNTAEENVRLMVILEKELKEIARRNGFKYTFAENANALTQQLATYMDCKRYATLQFNQWTNPEGNKPFAHCSNDDSVTVDVFEVDQTTATQTTPESSNQ